MIILRFTLGLTPTWTIWFNGNTPKIRLVGGIGVGSCNMSETAQGGTKVAMTD